MTRDVEADSAFAGVSSSDAGAHLSVLAGQLRRAGGEELGIPDSPGAGEALRRDALYRRVLAASDFLAALLATLIAVELLGTNDGLRPLLPLALVVVVLGCKVLGLYDRDENVLSKTTLEDAPGVFQIAALTTLIVWLGESVLLSGEIGKAQFLALWGLLLLTMLAGRTVARGLARRWTAAERCIVVGNALQADRVARKLARSHRAAVEVIGHIPLHEDPAGASPPLGTLAALDEVLVKESVERVILAPEASDSDEILDAVRLARSLGVKVSVLPRLFELVGSSVEFDEVEGMLMLGLRRDGLTRSSQLLKRCLDAATCLVGLFLLGPLFAGIALAVKLSSPGPVFFRQKRIGREGSEFSILKFRTMVEDADAQKEALRRLNGSEGLFKLRDDPRVTPLGRLLRRTALDELPQLVNVLRGEMSLVGPRPLVPDEDRQVQGWDRRRLHVTPGITGPWQLYGPYRIPLHEMVKMDYIYGANWSLWTDIKILLRTVPHALYRRGL